MAAPTRPHAGHRLEIRRLFAAAPDRLFSAWTSPEELKRWHAPAPLTCTEADIDLRVGGQYRFVMRQPDGVEHRAEGVFRVVERPRKLVYSWRWETKSPNNEQAATQVTLEFLPHGSGTELVLIHEGFPTAQDQQNHTHGWTAIMDQCVAACGAG